jgi:hypothetical protein
LSIPKFAAWSVLPAAILLLGGLLISAGQLGQGELIAFCASISLSWVLTLAAYSISYPGLDQPVLRFSSRLIGSMMLKMLAGVVCILVTAFQFREVLTVFSISFVIGYFVFTGFEVYSLLLKLRRKN